MSRLTRNDVVKAAAGRKNLIENLDELYELVEGLLVFYKEDFADPQTLLNTLQMFSAMLHQMPAFFPVGEKSLEDFPKATELLATANPTHFMLWFVSSLIDEGIIEQVVLRSMHHFFSNAVRNEIIVDMKQLRREFKQLRRDKPSKWLSHIYNVTQTVFIEIFLIEELLDEGD